MNGFLFLFCFLHQSSSLVIMELRQLIMPVLLLLHCIVCVCVCMVVHVRVVVHVKVFLCQLISDKSLRKCTFTEDDDILPQQNSNKERVYYTPPITLFESLFIQKNKKKNESTSCTANKLEVTFTPFCSWLSFSV